MRALRIVGTVLAVAGVIGLLVGGPIWMLSLEPVSTEERDEALEWAAETRAALERESCARTTAPGARELIDTTGPLAACLSAATLATSVELEGCDYRGDSGSDRCWTWSDRARAELPPFPPDNSPFRESFGLPFPDGEWPARLEQVLTACEPLDGLLGGAIDASAGCSPVDLGHERGAAGGLALRALADAAIVRAARAAAEHRGRDALELVLDGVRLAHLGARGNVRRSDWLLMGEAEDALWTVFQTLLDLDLGLTSADLDALDARLVSLRRSEPSIAGAVRTGNALAVDEMVRSLVPDEGLNTRLEAVVRRELHDELGRALDPSANVLEGSAALDRLVTENPPGSADDWRWLGMRDVTVLSRSVHAATWRHRILALVRDEVAGRRIQAARLRAARVLLALYRARRPGRCPSESDVDRALLDTPELGGPLELRPFPPADVLVHAPRSFAADTAALFVLTCEPRPVDTAGHWVSR